MKAQEEEHLRQLERLVTDRRVRPTLLLPLWDAAGLALGASDSLKSRRRYCRLFVFYDGSHLGCGERAMQVPGRPFLAGRQRWRAPSRSKKLLVRLG